jgi:hypothetical protein
LTVMGSNNPCSGPSSACSSSGGVNWNWPYYLECDEAALQLVWDLEDMSRDYADCFQNIPNHYVTGGLKSSLTPTSGSFSHLCSSPTPVSGRLEIGEPAHGSGHSHR